MRSKLHRWIPRIARRALIGASVAAVALALAAAGVANADSTPAIDFDFPLSSQQPNSATGATEHLLYKNPYDANAKPSPVRKLVTEAPAGTRFDGTAVPRCDATDSDLMTQGRDACPVASKVGSGTASVITGVGAIDPFTVDVTVFNGGDGVIDLFTQQGTNTTLSVLRCKFTAPNTITCNPAPTPGGPPDGESAPKDVLLALANVRGPSGRPFITTPPECPSSGTWVSHLFFSTADGHSYSATSPTTCLRSSSASGPPGPPPGRSGAPRVRVARMRLSIAPRRVVAGRRVRFRVRVRSSDPGCTSGVTIRFAGKHVRTDRHGRADIAARIRRPGRHRVTATRPGCSRVRVAIVARAPRRR